MPTQTQDWVMDPKKCEFEELFREYGISENCTYKKGYQITKLYFEYDQECTALKMALYRNIDVILQEPCSEENTEKR